MITTIENIENYLLTTIDDTFYSQVEEWIDGVESEMNRLTNRFLVADESDNEYKYDGSGKKVLVIDDFVSITKVERVGEDDDITEDVYQYPPNDVPKWRLESKNRVFTTTEPQNIKVSGKRGAFPHDDIPKDLVHVATIFVAGIINATHFSSGEVKREQIGSWTVEYQGEYQQKDFTDAKNLLRKYKRFN